MAQSAADSKKTPLHIEAFWEKPTATPTLTWDKWTQNWKLALLAKEGIQLDTLLDDPPASVNYPPEPTYEEPVENHTQATERDRKVRNQQLKVNWQNRCKKADEIGILCGDKPWTLCEQKTISLLYLSIGTEGRRIFKSKYPHFQVEKQPLKDLWQAMEESFTKVRNITYDRFVFYSCKQQKGESVESFYGRLIELAENCNLGSEETTLIRDAFILNMLDHETQKELLKETVEPPKALEIAIQMEMGAQNQQKINQNLMTSNTSVNYINNSYIRNRNANAPPAKRDFTRYPTVPANYQYTSVCTDCGLRWSHNHKQICPANGKKCHNCGILGHFARKCRKPKKQQNSTQKNQKANVNQIEQSPEKSDDEESVNYITSYQQLYQQVYDSNYESDSDDYVAAISSDSVHQLEPLNVEVQIGEIQTSAMIDSGSAVSIITKSLANRILQSTKSARWTDSSEKRNLKTFSNEPIKVIGHLETTVTYNHWKDVSAMLTVVDDGHKNIIGRDLFGPLRIAVVQQQPETDEDTIPGRSYLTEEQWADTALCSDTEIEKVICAASSRARLEQEKRKDGETRFIKPEAICREMPCSERSIQVKLARKRHESQRQKKNLDGLYEVLAPGSTVCKISPTTSVIKEPYKQEVRVRNSDIAKFGARAERETKLIEYIDRRPQKITEKTLEQKIQLHKKDLIRKNTGDKKIKRNKRQADDVSIVSSGRSCISTTRNIARSLKMRIPKRNPKYDTAFLNRPDLVQVLNISPIAPQMDDSTVAGPSASQTTSPTPTHPTPILKKTSKRNLTISDTSDSDTSSVRRSKRTLKKKKTQTIVEKVRNTEGYVDDQDIETVGDSYQNIDDRQEQPREMTVLQAETAEQSDSE